jgi:hypothetical protein
MTGWDEQLAKLEAEFPGWHIWRSDAGRLWATRTGAVLRRQPLGAGRVMTVDADDPGALRSQLFTQAELDREIVSLTPCGPCCAHRLGRTLWITGPFARLIEPVMHMP